MGTGMLGGNQSLSQTCPPGMKNHFRPQQTRKLIAFKLTLLFWILSHLHLQGEEELKKKTKSIYVIFEQFKPELLLWNILQTHLSIRYHSKCTHPLPPSKVSHERSLLLSSISPRSHTTSRTPSYHWLPQAACPTPLLIFALP